MANREALRELQSRLASRLQAARAEGPQATWLAVQAAGRNYLLPLAQLGEILPLGDLQAVPHTRDWFLGVANLRGGLYGVVDLGRYLGGRPPAVPSEAVRAEAHLVALHPALEVNCALRVDRLAGLRGVEAFAPAAAPADAAPYFGSGYTEPDGTCWQAIDLQALSRQQQFLSISA